MSYLAISLIALPVIFLISTFVSAKFAYKKSYWFFECFHLFGGFFVAMFFAGFFQSPALILSLVLAVELFWEAWELVIDRNPRLKSFLHQKLKVTQGPITLLDTLLDLFLGLLGAVAFLVLF